MESKEFPYIYPYSFSEAKRLKELDQWKSSHKENVDCKAAIEEAIRRDFDGMHLKKDCVESVIEQYGFKRVHWVLTNTVQQKSWDGRFSRENKDWAKSTFIPPDKDSYSNRNLYFTVDSHPAVLDGFINQYRRTYQALELFDHTCCEPDSKDMDYKGNVVVLSPDVLKENCWTPKDQLWLALGGFGCAPGARGRSVLATCLSDGETVRWNRSDFVGILQDQHLPDWAREKLMEHQEHEQGGPAMGGMEMK